MPGPPPKRSSQRRRRNKVDIDHVEVDGVVEPPELGMELHPLAAETYESLKVSGQARYMEPSDWQRARIFVSLLSNLLMSSQPSSMMYQALQKDMDALLMSEAERRRVRMEIERGPVDTSEQDAKVAAMSAYRRTAEKH